ncbi:SPO22-domain-containing protein [Byssothecium circinans]|uniref:SPO22-domain-containing protein n=1 Tax=Byssothecium circinans TaxID=147558 RepID=A0A6A5TJU9_9PLEO|nr:SPO22-domain-containing protein [Byssothecium circinans]
MASTQSAAKTEREKKLKAVLAFATGLTKRCEVARDATLIDDLESQVNGLPLQPSSTITAKREELDRIGTELWNLSTRLRREGQPSGKNQNETTHKNRTLCLLRVFAFFLLDSGSAQSTKAREPKACIRMLKVALKAAKVCIEGNEAGIATKVLERAAEHQEALSDETSGAQGDEAGIAERLRVEYFAVRTALAWRQDRMDTAEHMFTKCKQLNRALAPSTAESLADLLYEIGKDMLGKHNYELGVRWLERAYDILGQHELELLSAEAGDLRLSIMLSIVQSHMKLKSHESRDKAWNMVSLLEVDYEEKMAVALLKLEMLFSEASIDAQKLYPVIHRMIRTVILNEKNFATIMHNIHKLKDHSARTACKLIDELIEIRLFREEKDAWIEKAVVTRVWICCSTLAEDDALEQLQELFDTVARSIKGSFAAQATHAAQTLLWKRIEALCSRTEHAVAEKWCRLCLHPLFDKAGDVNKSKIARKLILCAQAQHDHAAAREVFTKMPETGRNDRITRYLMYKTGLHLGESDFLAECLDVICRQSTKDATLLYACILQAQTYGNNRHAISALEKVLDKYDCSAPADVHLPALLRMTIRLLGKELVVNGQLNQDVLRQICKVLEGAWKQAKTSRQRPSNPARDQFTTSEFEWFSKNAYNWSIKYCAEMQPTDLVRLLKVCIEFIKLLKEDEKSQDEADLSLRLMFCDFLATCTYTTLARAEDNVHDYLQYYLQARKHGKTFREIAADNIDKLGESARADIIAKHFQIVKLELEAALKLEQWDEMDELFDACFKFQNPQHYETLADLVLVIHSSIVKASLDHNHQIKLLSVLQKIIKMSNKQNGVNFGKLSRWIRCLYQLSITFDEKISLKCVEQAIDIAAARRGDSALFTPPPSSSPIMTDDLERFFANDEEKEPDHYPTTELEWLATTTFNHAVDYYVQENDAKCKEWAEKALALAGWAEDQGQLRALLMDKYKGLVWEDEK